MGLANSDADRLRDTVATPEGDGEFDPAEALKPEAVEAGVEGLQTPRGNAPAAYDADSPSELHGLVEVIDKVSRGKIQP